MSSVFSKYENQAWPYRFHATVTARNIAGGVPSDPHVAEGWLRSKLGQAKDDVIRGMVAETMAEREISADKATELVDTKKHLNGFKVGDCGLFIEGRQMKAAIKEAALVAASTGKLELRKWGKTGKGLKGFVAEHIMVVEDTLWLGVEEPTRVIQSFPKNARTGQTGISYTEIVDEAAIDFTVITDHKFTADEWAMLWLTGEQQGIGATRSQGYGRYEVTRWESV